MKRFKISLILLPFSILIASIGHGKNITLQVANWAGATEFKLEEQIVAEFMRRNPGVTVQVEAIPSHYEEKVLTRIAAGSPPDVFLLDATIVPSFVNKEVLVDLMPYCKEYHVDLSIYFPNVLKIAMRDSSLYALPKDFTPMVMYYNKRLFDASDLPYPTGDWTWDDYFDLSKKLTQDTDGDGTVDQWGTIFYSYPYMWEPWVWMGGGDILSPDGTRATGYFNSPETEETLRFLIDLRTKHKVAPHGQFLLTATGGATGLFYTNRIAMMESGHWWLINLKEYLDSGQIDVGVAPLPKPKDGKRVTVMYESGWCVPKETPHRELAVQLAIFLAGEHAARIRSESGIAIPAVISVAKEQVERDKYGLEQVFFDQVPYCRQPWGTIVEEFSRVSDIAKDAVDEVMIGGREIHATFTEAAQKMDKELTKYIERRQVGGRISGKNRILSFLFGVIGAAALLVLVSVLMSTGKERRKTAQGYAFLAPSLIHLLIFILGPVLFALYLSFHKWNIIIPDKPFVGLDNFIALLKDRLFWNALKNTAIYTLNVPVGMAISLAIAVMMNQRIKGVTFLRTLFFLPSVSSFVAIALVWQWIYNPQFGLANYLLEKIGLGPFSWLNEPSTALLSIMIMSIWIGIGYQMVIFLAGLQGIPGSLYEAAVVDGANAWQRFWKVTFPLLSPTTFFVLVTSMIGSFQVFTAVYVMTEGGPMRSTDVVVYHIYQNAWEYLKVGYASAMSWVLFIIIMIATWIQFKLLAKRIEYV
jgi:multiple sugar transport system permease protein